MFYGKQEGLIILLYLPVPPLINGCNSEISVELKFANMDLFYNNVTCHKM
jgi:hypothetical protein